MNRWAFVCLTCLGILAATNLPADLHAWLQSPCEPTHYPGMEIRHTYSSRSARWEASRGAR